MLNKIILSKLISWLIYLCIFTGLFFIVVRFIFISNEFEKLQNEAEKLKYRDVLHVKDIEGIIRGNSSQMEILSDTKFCSEQLVLCVEYPICYTCFVDVSHFLYEYALKNEKKMIVLCKTKDIAQVKKTLKFENLEKVKVNSFVNVHESESKMMVVLTSTNNNSFYLPLPQNREINFLETFLN